MVNTINYTIENVYQNGILCRNPIIEISGSSMPILCEGYKVQLPDSVKGSCIDFIITCTEECDQCGPKIKTVCFCETGDDCGPCQNCVQLSDGVGQCENICPQGTNCLLTDEGYICGECLSSEDCNCGQECIGNSCACPPDTFTLEDGCCVDCTEDIHCGQCESCNNGECISDCFPLVCNIDEDGSFITSCSSDENGCVECTTNSQCPGIQVCNDNCECGCPTGFCLIDGECVQDTGCNCNESACTGCDVCVNGICTDGCPSGTVCWNNECAPTCESETGCFGETCPNGLACIETDFYDCNVCSTCPDGYQAYQGQCYEICDCLDGTCSEGTCTEIDGIPCICISDCASLLCSGDECGDQEGCFCDGQECTECPNCNVGVEILNQYNPQDQIIFINETVNGTDFTFNIVPNIFDQFSYEWEYNALSNSNAWLTMPTGISNTLDIEDLTLTNGHYLGDHFIVRINVFDINSGEYLHSQIYEYTNTPTGYTWLPIGFDACKGVYKVTSNCPDLDVQWTSRPINGSPAVPISTWIHEGLNYAVYPSYAESNCSGTTLEILPKVTSNSKQCDYGCPSIPREVCCGECNDPETTVCFLYFYKDGGLIEITTESFIGPLGSQENALSSCVLSNIPSFENGQSVSPVSDCPIVDTDVMRLPDPCITANNGSGENCGNCGPCTNISGTSTILGCRWTISDNASFVQNDIGSILIQVNNPQGDNTPVTVSYCGVLDKCCSPVSNQIEITPQGTSGGCQEVTVCRNTSNAYNIPLIVGGALNLIIPEDQDTLTFTAQGTCYIVTVIPKPTITISKII